MLEPLKMVIFAWGKRFGGSLGHTKCQFHLRRAVDWSSVALCVHWPLCAAETTHPAINYKQASKKEKNRNLKYDINSTRCRLMRKKRKTLQSHSMKRSELTAPLELHMPFDALIDNGACHTCSYAAICNGQSGRLNDPRVNKEIEKAADNFD